MKKAVYHFLAEPKTGNFLFLCLIILNILWHYKILP